MRSQSFLGLSTRTEIWVPPGSGSRRELRGRENSSSVPDASPAASPRRLIPLPPSAGAHPDQRSIRRAPGRRSHDVRASRALLWHLSKIDHPFHHSLGQVGFGVNGLHSSRLCMLGDPAVSGFLSRKVFVAGIIAADHIGGATSQEAARSPSRAWAGDSGANVLVMGLFGVVFPSGLPDARWTQGFALAQVTALLSASSAVASTALVERGANLPAWQSFFIYVLLATFYVPSEWRARTRDRDRRARAEAFASAATSGEIDDGSTGAGGRSSADPWRSREDTPVTRSTTRYAALALIDTQANYLIVKAFQYTSLTSVTLLDCAAIPFSMALSRAALGGVYSRRHVLGGATSVMGLAILVLTDAYVRGANDAGSNPALGDFIVLLAAFGYASSNVLQEAALLDGASAVEVLAHVGGFGAVFSGIQCLALELDSLARLNATAGAAGIAELATFAASLFAMYSLVPEVLRRCGAAAFNVGMLSSDVWAFVARVLFFGGFGDIRAVLAFFASFFVVSAGLVVFLAAGDPLPPERKNQSSRYAALDEDVDAVVADLEDRGGGEREMIDVPPEPGRIRAQHIDVIS